MIRRSGDVFERTRTSTKTMTMTSTRQARRLFHFNLVWKRVQEEKHGNEGDDVASTRRRLANSRRSGAHRRLQWVDVDEDEDADARVDEKSVGSQECACMRFCNGPRSRWRVIPIRIHVRIRTRAWHSARFAINCFMQTYYK